ncbi:hypothetical protein [Streptomyces sp. NPDC050704]|uniref:hypothetical protein n=1 Tax=Streptomyces sp. NPDC050704 TaxID=3157219 RepID=UPI003440B62D
MYIRGVPLSDFQELTAQVSGDLYEGNVIVAPGAHSAGRHAAVASLQVADSRGFGARTAASGRHGRYACWHAYRDVLSRLFEMYPWVTVRTRLATYRGADGFDACFRLTEYHNLGSELRPRYIRELCVVSGCGDPSATVEIWELPSPLRADDLVARMRRELAEAEDSFPEEDFCGPVSLLGAPDLAYSGDR